MTQANQDNFLNVGGRNWETLATDRDLIHMGHNCNHLPLDSTIVDVMVETLRQENWRNYTPPYGFDELRNLIRDDVGTSDAEVLVTQGSTDAIYQFMTTVLSPGDEMIVSDPGWPHIANFGRSLGANVKSVPIYDHNRQYKLLPNLIREAMTPGTRLISIIDPLNPVGSSYTEAEIQEICRIAEENDAYVLHDSTYKHFADGNYYPAINYYDRAGVTVSLSKTAGFAGLRVGALLVQKELFTSITEKHVSRLGGNWIAQQGAIAAYKSMGRWLSRVLETNRRHQKMLAKCIEGVAGARALVFPSAGNFLAVDVIGTNHGAEEIVSAVLDEGIVIRSGSYTSQQFGDCFIRATTTVPTEHVERFCEAFPRAMSKLSRQ